MKKITFTIGMIFLIALATSASAEIRCLDTDEQATLSGGDIGSYCYTYYVSNCGNACYSGDYRSRSSQAGSCLPDHVPYTCTDAVRTVVTCTIYKYVYTDCTGEFYTVTAWYGDMCEDDS